jgi:probable phosphoglycerate mutase
MHVWLVRHGETADNSKRIFQGQRGSGLNRLGRAQAERIAARLEAGPAKIKAIVSSDLERAAETAGIVAAPLRVRVELDPDLRELDLGTWSGKSYDEVRRLYPEDFQTWLSGRDIRRGGGETYGELAVRVDRAIRRAAERHSPTAAAPIVIVSHGGAIKSWVAKNLGLQSDGWRALAGAANCGLTVVELVGAGSKLHSWNDVAHLDGLSPDEYSE